MLLNQPISEVMALPQDIFEQLLGDKELLRYNEARLFTSLVNAIAATFGKAKDIFKQYRQKGTGEASGEDLYNLSQKYK